MASLPELAFRHFIICSDIREHWLMTWHEDREISPGVPDLHYVMKGEPGEKFRVGWLELKAINTRITKSQHISVEPSQHQYCRKWTDHMPIHFLVKVQEWVYLVPGMYHREIACANCESDLAVLSIVNFHKSDLVEMLPPILREITRI